MAIEKYSIAILKPKWASWKIKLVDFLLESISILKIKATNRVLKLYGHKEAGPFIFDVLRDFKVPYEFEGVEHIPSTGPVTIVANHPGGADVLSVIGSMWHQRQDFKILANSLVCVRPVEPVVIPVEVMKKKDKIDKNLIHQTYQENKVIVFFAAGKNSRYDENNELKDRRWRTTFIDFAYQYKTPIQVLHIETKNKPLFYRISKIKEKFAFLKKVPLENMFQLREFHNIKEPIKLVYSKPIEFEEYKDLYVPGDLKMNRLLTDKLYTYCYTLKTDKNARFIADEKKG